MGGGDLHPSLLQVHWHASWQMAKLEALLQEEGPFPGPQTGLLSNTQNELSEETHVRTKQEIFIGKGRRGQEQEGKGTQENSSATWLTVLGFMVMGLVSPLSVANQSDSESFLVVHALFIQDGCQRKGLPKVVRHMVSPFDLSRTPGL